ERHRRRLDEWHQISLRRWRDLPEHDERHRREHWISESFHHRWRDALRSLGGVRGPIADGRSPRVAVPVITLRCVEQTREAPQATAMVLRYRRPFFRAAEPHAIPAQASAPGTSSAP